MYSLLAPSSLHSQEVPRWRPLKPMLVSPTADRQLCVRALVEIYNAVLSQGIDPQAAATLAVGLLHKQAGSPDGNGTTLEVLTPAQAAKIVGVSPTTMRNWCKQKLLGKPVSQPGSKREQHRILRDELAEYMRTRETTTPKPKPVRRKKDPAITEFF